MAVRAYETDLDLSVWQYGGQCPSCSGVLKYKYFHTSKKGFQLQVLPNKKRFLVLEGKKVVLQGSLTDMKILLEST